MRFSYVTLIAMCLSAFLVLGFGSVVSAQPFGGHPGGPGGGPFSQLTDEQRQTIHDLIEKMRAEEASRQEIHEAISELFAEWGLEMPEPPGGPEGRRGGDREREDPGDRLTEQQRATMHALNLEMWQEGASHQEIHEAVVEVLQGWGVEPPGRDHGHHGPGGFGPERGGFLSQLTDEKREVVQETIARMREQDASGEQIHEAVKALLEEWGIELPEHDGPQQPGMDRGGHLPGGIFNQLSEEQREQMRQLNDELRQQSAAREEIRTAVEQKLAEWGIELPEPPPELTTEQRTTLRAVVFELWLGGATRQEIHSAAAQQLEEFKIEMPEHGQVPLGHGPWPSIHGCLRPQLTEQQRETIHETSERLRQQGALPEEIRQAVQNLMSDFGIEMPDPDAELTDQQRAALRKNILDLWLAGADREDICQAVEDSLEEFGIELPEESDLLQSDGASETVPIRAQNYPNPANPETHINYTLGVSGEVSIQIYNISGQLVRAFDVGYQQPGSYSIRWDGRHQNGQLVASGVYFYRIQAGQNTVTNRIVLLK